MSRVEDRFAALQSAGRGGLVTFVTAGDPDPETFTKILAGLPGAGADLIELGMPFSDPMADGPAIQASSLRALKAGMTLAKTLEAVEDFRRQDVETHLGSLSRRPPTLQVDMSKFDTLFVGSGDSWQGRVAHRITIGQRADPGRFVAQELVN